MVMTKRVANELPATGPSRFAHRPTGRFTVACKPQRAQPIQFKPVRRPDQRSAVSIAGSCATLRSGAGSSGRCTPADGYRPLGSACSGDSSCGVSRVRAQSALQQQQQQQQRYQQSTKSTGYGTRGGDSGGGRFHFLRRNSFANNSAGANSQLQLHEQQDLAAGFGDELLINADDVEVDVNAEADPDAGLPSGWRRPPVGRRSFGTPRMGKTVSITASQEARTRSDIDRTASSRMCMRSQSEVATKSIIKLRPPTHRIISTHNEDPHTMGEARTESCVTPHQIREQKIFGECRFIPSDTFYKKALVAPNQERHFFAAPRCSRVPGSGMLYDIANQNSRHHQDCNFDSTRDMLRKACPTFCRTTQFRHIY